MKKKELLSCSFRQLFFFLGVWASSFIDLLIRNFIPLIIEKNLCRYPIQVHLLLQPCDGQSLDCPKLMIICFSGDDDDDDDDVDLDLCCWLCLIMTIYIKKKLLTLQLCLFHCELAHHNRFSHHIILVYHQLWQCPLGFDSFGIFGHNQLYQLDISQWDSPHNFAEVLQGLLNQPWVAQLLVRGQLCGSGCVSPLGSQAQISPTRNLTNEITISEAIKSINE